MPATVRRRRSGLNYVSRRYVLEPRLLQREIRYKATQAGVLALQLLQPLGLLDSHPAVLLAPAVLTLLGDPSLLAGLGQLHALRQLHLNLTQRHHNLLGAELSTSGPSGLLWFELILSISPAQKQPVRSPNARGLGIARRVLRWLEAAAREAGLTRLRLRTNLALREAQALYRGEGYQEVAPFNAEPYAHHWFEKL
jgi:GNAT superfamily N-acetyltransferase